MYLALPSKVGLIAVGRNPDGMMPLSLTLSVVTIKGSTMEVGKASWYVK
jgi:hypothetical protein